MLCVVVAVEAVTAAAHQPVGKTLTVTERDNHTQKHMKLHNVKCVCINGWLVHMVDLLCILSFLFTCSGTGNYLVQTIFPLSEETLYILYIVPIQIK